MQQNPLRGPTVLALPDRTARVPGRIVEDDHARFGVAAPSGEAVQRVGDLRTADRAFEGVEEGPLILGQEAKEVESLGREGRQLQGGANGLPGIRNRREGAKARAVDIEQIHPAGIGEALQAFLVILFTGEGGLIAAAFQRAAAPVPRIAELFFSARRSVSRQEVFWVAVSRAAWAALIRRGSASIRVLNCWISASV